MWQPSPATRSQGGSVVRRLATFRTPLAPQTTSLNRSFGRGANLISATTVGGAFARPAVTGGSPSKQTGQADGELEIDRKGRGDERRRRHLEAGQRPGRPRA